MTSAIRARSPRADKPRQAGARSRVAAQRGARPADRGRAAYGAYTDGANALTVGYADPVSPGLDAPPGGPPRRVSGPAKPTRGELAATLAAPLPAAPPLPLALPRGRFLLTIAAIVVVGVVGVLVLNTKINEGSFRLDRLRSEQGTLDVREQQLTQALAERESAGNLRAAATRLGLVPAGEPAFIRLPDGRVVGVPQPANGSSSSSSSSADAGR